MTGRSPTPDPDIFRRRDPRAPPGLHRSRPAASSPRPAAGRRHPSGRTPATPEATPPAGAVAGVIRDATAGRPLSGVWIAGDDRLTALSDSAGGYRLAGLAAGSHQLRFVREGYDTLTLGVLVAGLGGLPRGRRAGPPPGAPPYPRGDRRLAASRWPRLLAPTTPSWAAPAWATTGSSSVRPATATRSAPWPTRPACRPAGGHRRAARPRWRGRRQPGAARRHPALLRGPFRGRQQRDQPRPRGRGRPPRGREPGPLRRASGRRGGARDAGPRSRTRSPPEEPSVGIDVRQGLSGYVPTLHTGVSLAARTSYRSSLAGESHGAESLEGSGYGDLLGVATGTLGGGRLRVLSFLSRNRLAFPAFDDYGAGYRDGADDELPVVAQRHPVEQLEPGATWSRSGAGLQLQTTAWAAGSSAEISWGSAEGPERLRSTLAEVGVSARAAWPGADGGTSVGASLVRPDARYTVTGGGGLSLYARAAGRLRVRRATVASGPRAPPLGRPPRRQRLRPLGRGRSSPHRGAGGRHPHPDRRRRGSEPSGPAVRGERRLAARAGARRRAAGRGRRRRFAGGPGRPARGVRRAPARGRARPLAVRPISAGATASSSARSPPATSSPATASPSAEAKPAA